MNYVRYHQYVSIWGDRISFIIASKLLRTIYMSREYIEKWKGIIRKLLMISLKMMEQRRCFIGLISSSNILEKWWNLGEIIHFRGLLFDLWFPLLLGSWWLTRNTKRSMMRLCRGIGSMYRIDWSLSVSVIGSSFIVHRMVLMIDSKCISKSKVNWWSRIISHS